MDWPLSYAIDLAKRMVHVTYREQPSFPQWSQTMEQIFADPAFQPGWGILLDRRTLARSPQTDYIQQMVTFIDRHQANAGASRWAILVDTPGAYGMGRMAEQLSDETHTIRTFKQMAEAEAWLGGE